MRILVTGGSGFLGARLIPKLVDDGHAVFGLARSTSSSNRVRSLGATPVDGDLDDPTELSLPAVDAVVHAAALFRFAGPRAAYFRANVAGTQALLDAAHRSGATTFVYISAGAVVMDGRGTPLHNVDETAPTYPDSFSGYIASKARGEAAVLAANRPGFRTIALRPPAIWGPGGPFSTQLPGAIESGRFAFIADAPDGSEEWDMFLDIGAVHVGGRVRVLTDGRVLTWQSERGTRHTMRVEVTEDGDDAKVSMRMEVHLGGPVLGRVAELIARGIAGRHLVAGLEQLRHHLEYGPPA
jgi:nucleoside-diphosphate-sugar epimerase